MEAELTPEEEQELVEDEQAWLDATLREDE